MKDESKLQKIFREDMITNKTEDKFTGSKAVTVISMVGLCMSSFLFGFSFYNLSPSKMVLFLVMALVCAAGFINSIKARKNK